MACRRFAPADTVSGSGIASASVDAGEDGTGGNAVKVNGDSGDIGTECITDDVVVEMGGFSFACKGEVNARGLGVRTGVVVEGSGCVLVAGGEGGVDGGAAGVAVICCDNFEGGTGPYDKFRFII